MTLLRTLLLVSALLGSFVLAQTQDVTQDIARETFTVDLGDFETQAELSYPANAEGPFPTVLLIHGSTPMDMNASVFSPGADGTPELLSAIFGDIAAYLSSRGIAVVRYNKHYVTGPGQADYQAYYSKIDLQQLLADAEKVFEAAKALPQTKDEQMFLYGWSEGSTVAAELAANREDVAGLIVQGPVALPWRETFAFQIKEVGIPYLKTFAPEGQVTVETLQQAQAGEGGLVAKSVVSYFADPSFFQTGELKVSGFIDRNGDDAIDIDEEFLPAGLEQTLDFLLSPMGPLSIYSEARALPTLLEQVDELAGPVLILQGANDANVPARGAGELAEALEATGANVTLHVYEGLGHSLGPAESLIADNFQPIAKEPLEDTLAWLQQQTAN